MMNPDTNFGLEEASMAQLDDSVGSLLKALDDMGIADNTIVIFTTDNGAEPFTWPDGAMTPFRASKGTIFEGGFLAHYLSLAGPCQTGHRRKRNLLRPRLVSQPACRRGQSEHQGSASQGRDLGRPNLQEPSRRLQPARSTGG